jgi:hypothetical protein
MGYQEPVRLQVLGVGDAFSFVHHNTCFLLCSPSGRALIDGTPGLFRLLHQRGVLVESIDNVILTHIHADHAAGIESFLLYRRFRLGRKTRLFTSSRVMDSMKEGFFPSFRDGFSGDLKRIEQGRLEDYVEFIPLSETESAWILPEVEVEIRHNWHPVPTLGLKLRAHETTVGISGDHCFHPGLLRELLEEGRISQSEFARMAGPWLWESDLIYHEVTRQSGGGHTVEQELLSLSDRVRSKLRLLHAPDGFIPGPLAMAAEGEQVVIFPGQKFEIKPSHPCG